MILMCVFFWLLLSSWNVSLDGDGSCKFNIIPFFLDCFLWLCFTNTDTIAVLQRGFI